MMNSGSAIEVVLELPAWKEPFNRETYFKFLEEYKAYRVAGGRHNIMDCIPMTAQLIFLVRRTSILQLAMEWDRTTTEGTGPGAEKSVIETPSMTSSRLITTIQGKLRFSNWQELRRYAKAIQCNAYTLEAMSTYVSKWDMIHFYLPEDTPGNHEDLHKLFVDGIRHNGLKSDIMHRKDAYNHRDISILFSVALEEAEKANTLMSRASAYMQPDRNDQPSSERQGRHKGNRDPNREDKKKHVDRADRMDQARSGEIPHCNYCGKPGHTEATCYTKNPSLRTERASSTSTTNESGELRKEKPPKHVTLSSGRSASPRTRSDEYVRGAEGGKLRPSPKAAHGRTIGNDGAKLPIIEGKLGVHSIKFLLDTGAETNFIDQSILGQLWDSLVDITESRKSFQTMGGTVEARYRVTFTVSIGTDQQIHLTAYVLDLKSTDFRGIVGIGDICKYDMIKYIRTQPEESREPGTTKGEPQLMTASQIEEPHTTHHDDIDLGDMLERATDGDVTKVIHTGESQLADALRITLVRHLDVFQSNLPEEGACMKSFRIDLIDEPDLPRSKPRYFSPRITALINEEVARLEQSGIITKSKSNVASPVVAKLKPDGTLRLCIDYVRLNKSTIPVQATMPSIPYILGMMQGQLYFATMDLRQGYYQALVEPQSRYLTAFTCSAGLYEFTRVAFGLRNAPGFFQNEMNKILHEFIGRSCFVFIDDVIIFARSAEEFNEACDQILDCLERHNIRLKLEKCSFGASQVKFLGFQVDANGLRMDDSRKQGIRDMMPPRTKKQLRSFLGATGFHRQFIPNYHKLVAPLQALLRKDAAFEWSPLHMETFQRVKDAVIGTDMLYHLDYTRPIGIRTDASTMGVGAELFQEYNGCHQPVAYLSHAFSDVESRWATIEQEAFAIYFAVMKWGHLLMGHPFIVESDHRNLEHLFKSDVPKLVRWRLRLQEYDFQIRYIPGRDNLVADALSRCFAATSHRDLIASVHNAIVGHHGRTRTVRLLREGGHDWPGMTQEVEEFISSCPLCQKVRLGQASLDAALRSSAVDKPGAVWSCDTMGPMPTDVHGFKYIIVCEDAFTRYIELLPCKDATSKSFADAFLQVIGRHGFPRAIRSDRGPQFASHLVENLMDLFSMDHQFTMPYRPESNGIVERANKEVGRHLKTLLATIKSFDSWSTYLPLVQRIINTSYHQSIGTCPARLVYGDGWNLAKGILDADRPDQDITTYEDYVQTINDVIKSLMSAAHDTQEKIIQSRIEASPDSPTHFDVGSYVLWEYPDRPPSKLMPRWRGPCIVVEEMSDGNRYLIQHLNTMKVSEAHITMLKPFIVRDLDGDELRELAAIDQGEEAIECILTHTYTGPARRKKKSLEDYDFHVRWRGYDDSEDLWLPYAELKDTEALGDYLATHPELPSVGEV